MKQAAGYLVEYMGADKLLRDITPGDADEWRRWLSGTKKLGENTLRRHCGRAKQFFRAAVRKRIIAENPFGDMKECRVQANEARFHFVTPEETQAVLDACPDDQWRLLVALARYGGLRTPSESLLLKWSDIDWERGRMTVTSPKTEHHAGKETRVVPLFPELRKLLDKEFFTESEERSEYVITRYRDCGANLRTQLLRIIRRAGLKPWEKPFQNMRSTRETELCESFPIHVVCKWIGNTEAVAKGHYLQVTDEHFARAGENPGEQDRQTLGNVGEAVDSKSSETPVFPNVPQLCTTDHTKGIPPRGFEPRLPD